MRGVSGQWALEVLLDGTDLKLDPSVLGNFNLISNIHQDLPSLNFTFKDERGVWAKRNVPDGTPIELKLGLPDDLYTGKFVTVGTPDIKGGTITIRALLDKAQWLRKVVDKSYKGNSSDVLQSLASEVGLKIDADTTNDSMTWLPNRMSLAQYARHVVERSFAGADTAMIMALTDQGVLRFKDLNKLIDVAASATFSNIPGAGELKMLGHAITSKAHVANNNTGYGSTSIGVNEDGSVFEANKVATKLFSGGLSIGKVFGEAIGDLGGRIRALPPLAGNTHKNWNQAQHQNERITSTYAYDFEMLTDVPSKLQLLDLFKANPQNPLTGEPFSSLVGKYITTATNKFIMGNRYYEKLVGTAQGPGGV